jgi:hypothetical protein
MKGHFGNGIEQIKCGYKQVNGWRGKVKCEGRSEIRSTVTIEQRR